MAEALRSERNQGRSPDMSEIEHDRIGFNYRMTDIQAAIGIAQVERLDELLGRAGPQVAAAYARAARQRRRRPAGRRATPTAWCCPAPTAARSGAAGSSIWSSCPRGADRGAVIDALADRGHPVQGLSALHPPMPPYRERFGFKGGEFPVAERVAERSLALPFFTSMTEEQVERVCTALAGALGKPPPKLAAHVAVRRRQDPLFRRINSSISFDRRLAPFDVEQSRAHARALDAARGARRRPS